MAGNFVARPMSDGVLGVAQAALYTVPDGTTAYVKQIFLHNVSATKQVIDLWLKANATARKWRRLELEQNESADLLEDGEALQLEQGDTIEALTTTAAVVSFTITGVEET